MTMTVRPLSSFLTVVRFSNEARSCADKVTVNARSNPGRRNLRAAFTEILRFCDGCNGTTDECRMMNTEWRPGCRPFLFTVLLHHFMIDDLFYRGWRRPGP